MSKLDDLKAAFKSTSSNNRNNEPREPSNYYNFWNMEFDDSTTVRFLPDKDSENPLRFMLEKHMHELTINGQKRRVPCLKMYHDECPICKVSAGFYKEGNKEEGLKYYRKKSYVAQALVLKDPLPADPATGETNEGKVRFLTITPQIFKVIQEAFESGDLDERPFEYKGGYNFIIKRTKQGDGKANYIVGTKFQAKQSDLTADQIEFVEENIVELKSLLPAKPTVEKVEAMLQAALNGGEYVDPSKSNSKPASSTQNLAQQLASSMNNSDDEDMDDVPASTAKTQSVPAASDDGEEEADDIIRRIRERRANRDA